MKIVVTTWQEAASLTPVAGTTVVVVGTGSQDNPEGKFTWFSIWNPVAREYQIVRG